MTTLTAETIHRYPRLLRWGIELLSTVFVTLAFYNLCRAVLRYLWTEYGRDDYILRKYPQLRLDEVIVRIDPPRDLNVPTQLTDFIAPLVLLGVALLVALLVRNALPTIRTSGMGILVEFAGDWLPVRWDELTAIKATQNPGGQYVVLLQTGNKALTSWHRFYSFLYRLGYRRGFLITSAITQSTELMKTILQETDRLSGLTDRPPVRLDERAVSPLFYMLLSPVGFFSRRTAAEQIGARGATVITDQSVVEGAYPQRIRTVLKAVIGLFTILGLLRYLKYLGNAISKLLGGIEMLDSPDLIHANGLWLLLAAHLIILLLVPALVALWALLPDLRAQPQGLAVRYFSRWLLVPWQQITSVKAASLSEQNHVLLIESLPRNLRPWHRLSSMLFDGVGSRGVLVTSAISNFEPLLQRLLLAVSRVQAAGGEDEEAIFHDNALAPGIGLLFHPGPTLERMVRNIREDDSSQNFSLPRALQLFRVPLLLAALPMFLLAETVMIEYATPPSAAVIGALLGFLFWGLMEWPIVATLASALEGNLELDAHGARPYYLYPVVQIPRLIPMALAVMLALVGISILPTLVWLAAIAWSSWLTIGLWAELYNWHGPKLLVMGLAPAIFQLLTMGAFAALI